MSDLSRAAIYAQHKAMVDALQVAPPPAVGITATRNISPLDHVTRLYWRTEFPVSAKPKRARA